MGGYFTNVVLPFAVTSAGVGIGSLFGKQIFEYIAYLSAYYMIATAIDIYDQALALTLDAYNGSHFTIAIAIATVNQHLQLFITMNDFYADGFLDVFHAFGDAARNFLINRASPGRFLGGNYVTFGIAAKHAEEYMVELLQSTNGLDDQQFIIGGVSNRICYSCQDLKQRSRVYFAFPAGVLYAIDRNRGIRLFLASLGLE
jgi:hypothetical protein